MPNGQARRRGAAGDAAPPAPSPAADLHALVGRCRPLVRPFASSLARQEQQEHACRYVAGLLCWAYTVLKLVTIGRMAGFGLGLMFIAGYALQLSHLTLMVVLGLVLLTLDRRRAGSPASTSVGERTLINVAPPILGGQAS